MKIAIIGGGAAGLTTAYLLDKTHAVTLFEKRPILGGNVRTLGKNVASDRLPNDLIVDNGVIEFQRDHFVNFHRLLDKLEVKTELITGGSSSLFLADGRYILGPGVIKHSQLSRAQRLTEIAKLLRMWPDYHRFREQLSQPDGVFKHQPVSAFLGDEKAWHMWQKMLLMYGYSIPYAQIADFPAEIAVTILRDSDRGTRWTRIVGGVYTYMQRMIDRMAGDVIVNATITGVRRDAEGVAVTLADGVTRRFDKVVFATPPDQVLALLADAREEEIGRFAAWHANFATTHIHTDVSIYARYGVRDFSEFDVFQKEGGAGYNAYLNRLCGLAETAPHYCLAFNLDDCVDAAHIVDTQHHHTPLYTAQALRHPDAVIATNGDHHTYFAGAWLDNGLHEGAVNSALRVSRLLGGELVT